MNATVTRQVKIINPTIGFEADKILRMAAYCRVSTDSDDQANSFLAQVKYYNDYISSRDDMTLVDIYADEGITGTCMAKREDFKRLMKDCSLGRIDRVLVKSVSRFARNSLECLEAIRLLKEYGVSVLFENDNIDTKTMNSEMILYVKSAFAQSEALSGSKRVSTACRMKMENGNFLTYHAPFGFRLVEQKLVIEPSEAETVKRIFDMYLSGIGMSRIAIKLNTEGADGKEHWSATMIRYILSNEKYIGDSLLQKTYTPQVFPLRNIPNRGELDKYYVKDSHSSIISHEEFDTVQELIAQRASTEKAAKKTYTLSKVLYCECGWAYRHRVQNGIDYWVCSRKSVYTNECDAPNIVESDIYNAYVRMYNKLRLFEKEVLDSTLSLVSELRNKLVAGNSEIKQIDIEIAKLCEQNNRYEKYREKKIMDDISYMEQTNRLKARLAELRSRRLKILNENDDEKIYDDLRLLKETLQNYPKAITAFDEKLFDSIIDKIKVGNDGTLSFILKGGLCLREKVGVRRK